MRALALEPGSDSIPAGSQAFWTDYISPAGVTIRGEIDYGNAISETNETNNKVTRSF